MINSKQKCNACGSLPNLAISCRHSRFLLVAALVGSLSACGGDSGSAGDGLPVSDLVTLTPDNYKNVVMYYFQAEEEFGNLNDVFFKTESMIFDDPALYGSEYEMVSVFCPDGRKVDYRFTGGSEPDSDPPEAQWMRVEYFFDGCGITEPAARISGYYESRYQNYSFDEQVLEARWSTQKDLEIDTGDSLVEWAESSVDHCSGPRDSATCETTFQSQARMDYGTAIHNVTLKNGRHTLSGEAGSNSVHYQLNYQVEEAATASMEGLPGSLDVNRQWLFNGGELQDRIQVTLSGAGREDIVLFYNADGRFEIKAEAFGCAATSLTVDDIKAGLYCY